MEHNTVELICRHCGKTIQIPQELQTFSCVYCGQAMSKEEFLPAEPAVQLSADDADRSYAETHLIDCIEEYSNYFKYFTKKDYNTHYYTYLAGIRPIFEAMDRYVQASTDKDAVLTAFACRFLDDREAYHKKNKLWKMRKDTLLFESKLLIALYMTPAILEMDLSVSQPFVEQLHKQFLERYPKDPYIPATHDEIASGFRGRKLCFITTAVCEFEGKPDNCAELQAFRGFRDGWLSDCPDGHALIEEYYRIAPSIVTMINFCDDRSAVCQHLRDTYLSACYQAICKQEYAACKNIYVKMVHDLQERYCLS